MEEKFSRGWFQVSVESFEIFHARLENLKIESKAGKTREILSPEISRSKILKNSSRWVKQ